MYVACVACSVHHRSTDFSAPSSSLRGNHGCRGWDLRRDSDLSIEIDEKHDDNGLISIPPSYSSTTAAMTLKSSSIFPTWLLWNPPSIGYDRKPERTTSTGIDNNIFLLASRTPSPSFLINFPFRSDNHPIKAATSSSLQTTKSSSRPNPPKIQQFHCKQGYAQNVRPIITFSKRCIFIIVVVPFKSGSNKDSGWRDRHQQLTCATHLPLPPRWSSSNMTTYLN
ncbi:hypothetical protein ACLOJK_005379 [Asimina triloba]